MVLFTFRYANGRVGLAPVEAADVVIPRTQEGYIPTHGAIVVSAAKAGTAIVDVLPPSDVVAEVLYRTCLVIKRPHPGRVVGSVCSTAVVIVCIENTGIRRLTGGKEHRGR